MSKNDFTINEGLKISGFDKMPPYWLIENTSTGERWPLTIGSTLKGANACSATFCKAIRWV